MPEKFSLFAIECTGPDGKTWLLQSEHSKRTPVKAVLFETAEKAEAYLPQVNGLGDEHMKGVKLKPVAVTVEIKAA